MRHPILSNIVLKTKGQKKAWKLGYYFDQATVDRINGTLYICENVKKCLKNWPALKDCNHAIPHTNVCSKSMCHKFNGSVCIPFKNKK